MWFGLYSRYNKKMDSSGFEHIFAGSQHLERFINIHSQVDDEVHDAPLFDSEGEIKGGKVSGFHNWIQFYLLEKSGQLNYYSHSFNGPVGIPSADP